MHRSLVEDLGDLFVDSGVTSPPLQVFDEIFDRCDCKNDD